MTGKRKRTDQLSVTFRDGFADGWAMAVSHAFRPALDIAPVEWVIDGIKCIVITEGVPPCYDFHRGDLLYDTPLAYQLPWGEAMKHIRLSVQVMHATPDMPHGTGKTEGSVSARISHGDGERLCHGETIHVTQSQFVEFLKTGQQPSGGKHGAAGQKLEAAH